MSADFLLELRSEEIPARMQAGARADLERLFRRELAAAGVTPGEVSVWSTPRRLALVARDLPLATEAVREELKGPRTSAPAQALDGFLRKTGLTAEQLTERDGVWYAVLEKPGRATADVLAAAIPAIIRAFPWPKSQRWGADSLSSESLRWVRPLSGIVALLDGEVVPFEVGGVVSGRETLGHRFHHHGPITIGSADDYAPKLHAAHVIVDHVTREAIVRDGAHRAAAAAGLQLVEDEGLVIENAGLTEWPVPLLGRFDEAFLSVPPEVIQLTARVNQKYFIATNPPRNGEGDHAQHGGGDSPQAPTLANAFICTANIAASDGGTAIIAGNRKVLAARLSDARFFWEQDLKIPLSEHANKLARIIFHEDLGNVLDRCDRIAGVMGYLSGAIPVATDLDDPSAKLQVESVFRPLVRMAKADLVTEMVGEFPELQGVIGGYYAKAAGASADLVSAIKDHYSPTGANDSVPETFLTACLALADKIEMLSNFFYVGIKPTGSRDPYALRRAALGVCRIVNENDIRFRMRAIIARSIQTLIVQNLNKFIEYVESNYGKIDNFQNDIIFDSDANSASFKGINFPIPEELRLPVKFADGFSESKVDLAVNQLFEFLIDRLKVQQREAGVRHDLIDAVFALGGEDDLVRLLARVHALQAFVGTEDGRNLLAGYKRAANILKKESWAPSQSSPERGGGPAKLVEGSGSNAPESRPGAPPLHHPAGGPPPRSGEDLAEAALIAALASAEPGVEKALGDEDFTAAMAALAGLRAPIDAFFETVTVNDADPDKRARRLALLDQFRAAVHKVADFSRIEG